MTIFFFSLFWDTIFLRIFRPPCVLLYSHITSSSDTMRRLMMQWLPIRIKAAAKILCANLLWLCSKGSSSNSWLFSLTLTCLKTSNKSSKPELVQWISVSTTTMIFCTPFMFPKKTFEKVLRLHLALRTLCQKSYFCPKKGILTIYRKSSNRIF